MGLSGNIYICILIHLQYVDTMYMYIKLSFEGKKEGETLRNIYNRKHVYEQIELFMCLGVNLHWCV